jgi:hypothetical protein
MGADLEGTLYNALLPFARSATRNSPESQKQADTVASTVAKNTAERMNGAATSNCEFNFTANAMAGWTRCVLAEALSDLTTRFQKSSDSELTAIAQSLQKTETMSAIVDSMSDQMTAIYDIVSLLRNGSALNDLPWIAKSFFEGRRFVLTNSLQQESVGTSRVLNLDSLVIHFELNAGRLFVIRDAAGAYDGSSREDMIVTSYPVRATRTAGGDTFYQIDFSAPDNKRILVPHLAGYKVDRDVDITAESIKIRIANAEKPPRSELGTREAPTSGLFFDVNDTDIVLDELILVNSTTPDTSDNEETDPGELSKEILRPTIRFSQGFFALDKSNDNFATEQLLDLKAASAVLFNTQVEDGTEGVDDPYFVSQSFLAPDIGIDPELIKNVRKYNVKKELVFVLSRNTPAVAIPVLKSAINSYADLFNRMTPAGQQPLRITALTQKEFEESNRDTGLKLGGSVNAADPRVNMIQWDDNPNLGAAWATAAAHPYTGEIISADVLMSGATWGMVGCTDFLTRTWASKPKPGEKPAPFPHAATSYLNGEICKMALFGMKLIGSTEHTGAQLTSTADGVDIDRVTRLTEAGDQRGLNDELAKLLGRQLPDANGSDLVRRPGETEEQYATRLEAATLRVTQAFRAQSPDPIPDTLAGLKSVVDAGGAANDRKHDTHPEFTFTNGKNLVHAKPDCVLHAVAGRNAFVSNAGVPGITSEFVKDPKQAALATIRIVLVHELGHTFGLRHNFVASTTPGELEEGSVPPVPVSKRTDSIMDYNDSGVEMDMGAMSDYTNPAAGSNSPSFGIYDVISLANIYGLDASAIKLKTKTKFCTDRNRSLLANCLPFDYGSDSMEHALYQMNLMVQELRMAKDTDLQFGPVTAVLLNRYQRRISAIGGQLADFWSMWGQFEQLAAYSTNPDEQAAIVGLVDKLFYAKGLEQEFFNDQNFKNKAGMAPLGLWSMLNLSREMMTWNVEKPQAISTLFATELRRIATLAYLSEAKTINDFGGTQSPDARYMKGLQNITFLKDPSDTSHRFRDILSGFFSRKVLVPSGETARRWIAIVSGTKITSADALDPAGNPINLVLTGSLFNHKLQTTVMDKVLLSDGKGGSVEGIPVAQGENDIKDMLLALLARAQLAPWGGAAGGSDIFESMKRERNELEKILTSGAISEGARDSARYILSVYDEILANEFKPL